MSEAVDPIVVHMETGLLFLFLSPPLSLRPQGTQISSRCRLAQDLVGSSLVFLPSEQHSKQTLELKGTLRSGL